MTATDTREIIMSAARAVVQAEGYNALSFRELAKEVGVKSASIHYHFPTKGDLGAALARRYTEDLETYLAELSASSSEPSVLLRRYTAIFRQPLVNENRMCMYGIMAAEHDALPDAVRAELDRFIDANIRWVAGVLGLHPNSEGDDANRRHARAIFAAIEGAQLIARGRRDVSIFDETIESYRKAGLLP